VYVNRHKAASYANKQVLNKAADVLRWRDFSQ
jgi:hypothetical protein